MIAGIGITNQRETTLVWDRNRPACLQRIVWQDRRTADICAGLRLKGRRRNEQCTGLVVDPYFSAKIRPILDNVDGARQRAESGELALALLKPSLSGV